MAMTASLDRAVEVAEFLAWCSKWFGPDSDEHYLKRAIDDLPALAALPHLGVDREALRGLADSWVEEANLHEWNAAEAESIGFDMAAKHGELRAAVKRKCAESLIHLIETNQEAT